MDPTNPTVAQTEMYQAIIMNKDNPKFVLKYHDPYGNTWTTHEIVGDTMANNAKTCASIELALLRLPNFALNSNHLIVHGSISVTVGDALPIVRDPTTSDWVTVGTAVTADLANVAVCIVAFPAAPGTTGYQPLLECDPTVHNSAGHQPRSAGTTTAGFTCLVKEHYKVIGTAPAANDVILAPLSELATCSNRGICNGETGKCACFTGHTGLACELQEALV